MLRQTLRLGESIQLRSGVTAYVIAKYHKTVRIRERILGDIRTIRYRDIVSTGISPSRPLLSLLPHLTHHNFAFTVARGESLLREQCLSDWDIQIDEDARGRGGQCGHTRRVIAVTKCYIERASQWDIQDTLLHEIAHALVGPGHNHNQVWRKQALALGCTGEVQHNVYMPPVWIKWCPNGHWVTTAQRRSRKRMVCMHCRARVRYEEYTDQRYEQLREEWSI